MANELYERFRTLLDNPTYGVAFDLFERSPEVIREMPQKDFPDNYADIKAFLGERQAQRFADAFYAAFPEAPRELLKEGKELAAVSTAFIRTRIKAPVDFVERTKEKIRGMKIGTGTA